jgi:3-oxo-5-alpha-steroid 4-dehydrogenase 1
MMGKTSGSAPYLLPGRIAWVLAEAVAPLNMLYIVYALPQKLKPPPDATTSILGTGLPIQHEILVLLYLVHYLNRAFLTPVVFAPSVSPMAPWIAFMMVFFQYGNSTNVGCWNVYSAATGTGPRSLLSPLAGLGLGLWVAGFYGNIVCEHHLFDLRKGAAKRKAKSEGKAIVSYEKVYVIPPAEGAFKHVLYPHYVLEWVEWMGYWVMGGAWGLGWGLNSAALWFVIAELCVMLPRAWQGKEWYEQKFGKRAVAGRAAALPFLGI